MWKYIPVSGQSRQIPAHKAGFEESRFIDNGLYICSHNVTAIPLDVSFQIKKFKFLTPIIRSMRYGGIVRRNQPLIARFRNNLPT